MNPILSALRNSALIATAAAAGWWLRGPEPADVVPRVQPEAAILPPLADATPLIAVSSDGQVTLRVEQQPLEWVLEQIARQTGRAHPAPREAGRDPAAAATVGCAELPEPPRRDDAQRLLQAIERGGEEDRYDGLLAAREEALGLPPSLLRTIYETDGSERVRLLAFDAWAEQHADRPALLREALGAAALLPGEAVQREAQRRLDELDLIERPDPGDPQRQAVP